MIHRFEHHGLLGTFIELRLAGLPARHGRKAERGAEVLLAEIERLQAIFSAYDSSSELCRWRTGELKEPSPEFGRLMGQVLQWWDRSGGAFNPLAGRLSRLWASAESSDRSPDDDELARAVAELRRPCYSMIDGLPVVDGNCRDLTVNALAKGYIVDRSLDVLIDWLDENRLIDIETIVVNAGGDLGQRGTAPSWIGIENPLRPYDNEPPLAVVELHDQAMATSGGSRRGFTIAGRRYSHLLDPRTGRPVDHSASVTIVAGDAMTADVVATAASVMAPHDAVVWIDSLDGAAGLIIDAGGTARVTARWGELTAGSA